ncbi:MAG: aminomethyl-transferring glycine dehydrogenase [Phycisphaerales bacterium]
MTTTTTRSALTAADRFVDRHLGQTPADLSHMLRTIGVDSVDQLIEQTVPSNIRLTAPLELPAALGEFDALRRLESVALKNQIHRSYIGCGYHNTATPAVLRRNILENPGWYTQYTPYQAEISQGRLEALLNFQTMICDLTGLPVANASLLDEATAAAEAMAMCVAASGGASKEGRKTVLIADHCHPQNIAVCQTRGWSMNIDLQVVNIESPDFDLTKLPGAGVIVQYPTTDGRVIDYSQLAQQVHAAGGLLVMIADPLALTLLKSPGEIGADIAVGSTQRFGCPMGAGGPHAAYMACRADLVRKMPGRLVGVSRDAQGNPALRLSIQTREQHIKRDKATSNICTAQALPAIIASMFAVYHGPTGLKQIATRVFAFTQTLAAGLKRLGYTLDDAARFDTITLQLDKNDASQIIGSALQRRMNLRDDGIASGGGRIGITLDETTTRGDLSDLLDVFAKGRKIDFTLDELADTASLALPQSARRTTAYLTHPVFNRYHTEHEMLRYLTRLQARDLSLTTSMIPLGSCTMKLNPAAAMLPITWPQFAQIHPFAPVDQMRGYHEMFTQLESWLAAITGFDAISLQPNAGSQGEYAGLLAIRRYHESRATPGSVQRDVCLIPTSAHGTNPASAVIAGFRVVAVGCRDNGDIDLDDLRLKAAEHADQLAAFMITYPSTHGVFENTIIDACRIIHDRGGQVYMDGANMNAQVGLTSPGSIGADVCHLNLHKTFCIPHGGGGPGMGPIGVKTHLKPFLPGDPIADCGLRIADLKSNPKSEIRNPKSPRPVSAAPFGSASVLAISWMYIQMMGPDGLKHASEHAILNANYMAARLREKYKILYTNSRGKCAHEFIVDCRPLADTAHVTVEDIAKRLMDYGFHAPTMSWPVGGTLMIEPTESESRAELDRLCDALLQIHDEARQIQRGEIDAHDNPLKNAPHTQLAVTADDWRHPYSRQTAAFPANWLKVHKFWPPVARIDNPFGDRNLVCTCPSVEEMQN